MTQISPNHYYVYGHYTKDTDELFYVGMGKNKRSHSKNGRNRYWHRIVNKYGYYVKVLYEGLTQDEAFFLEIKLIKELDPKCNLTPGGMAGHTHFRASEEEKKIFLEKKRQNMLGKNTGPKSQETRQKLASASYCKKVKCIETGVIYKSMVECAKNLNCITANVSKCIRKKYKCKGFTLELVENE